MNNYKKDEMEELERLYNQMSILAMFPNCREKAQIGWNNFTNKIMEELI